MQPRTGNFLQIGAALCNKKLSGHPRVSAPSTESPQAGLVSSPGQIELQLEEAEAENQNEVRRISSIATKPSSRDSMFR